MREPHPGWAGGPQRRAEEIVAYRLIPAQDLHRLGVGDLGRGPHHSDRLDQTAHGVGGHHRGGLARETCDAGRRRIKSVEQRRADTHRRVGGHRAVGVDDDEGGRRRRPLDQERRERRRREQAQAGHRVSRVW
ncbi:MAG: hypothetical protein U0P30_15435 [Vicinamibacterales bacterium]